MLSYISEIKKNYKYNFCLLINLINPTLNEASSKPL